jgi:hypothetical protein
VPATKSLARILLSIDIVGNSSGIRLLAHQGHRDINRAYPDRLGRADGEHVLQVPHDPQRLGFSKLADRKLGHDVL